MRIRVINPNTTAAMTATIATAAREAGGAGTEIDAVTSTTGPVSIEGYYDEACACPACSKEIRQARPRGPTPTSSPASMIPASTPRGSSRPHR